MQAYSAPTMQTPAGAAEPMDMRRAWLGDAEHQRQQALLRTPRSGVPERQRMDRRAADRRQGNRRAQARSAS